MKFLSLVSLRVVIIFPASLPRSEFSKTQRLGGPTQCSNNTLRKLIAAAVSVTDFSSPNGGFFPLCITQNLLSIKEQTRTQNALPGGNPFSLFPFAVFSSADRT